MSIWKASKQASTTPSIQNLRRETALPRLQPLCSIHNAACPEAPRKHLLCSPAAVRRDEFSVSSDSFHHAVDEHVRRHLWHPWRGSRSKRKDSPYHTLGVKLCLCWAPELRGTQAADHRGQSTTEPCEVVRTRTPRVRSQVWGPQWLVFERRSLDLQKSQSARFH